MDSHHLESAGPRFWFDDVGALIVRLARQVCVSAPVEIAPDPVIEPDPSDPMVCWLDASIRVARKDLIASDQTWSRAAKRLCAATPVVVDGLICDVVGDEIEDRDLQHPCALIHCWIKGGAPGLMD